MEQSQSLKQKIAKLASFKVLRHVKRSNYKGRGILIKTWFSNFVGFFELIGNRKVAESHFLVPNWSRLGVLLVIIVISIVLLNLYADPAYMEWFKVNDTDDPTSIFTKTTDLAKVDLYLIVSFVAMIIISVWKIPPRSKLELTKWHHWFMGFYFVFTSIAFSGLITLLLKHVFGRVRPNANDGSAVWQSFPFQGGYDFLSFPSGHSTTAGVIAMIVFLFAPRLAPLGFAFALWIGVSRLAVGAHYPTDVLAGLSVGMIFTWIYARSFARKRLLFCFDRNGKLAFRKPYGSR